MPSRRPVQRIIEGVGPMQRRRPTVATLPNESVFHNGSGCCCGGLRSCWSSAVRSSTSVGSTSLLLLLLIALSHWAPVCEASYAITLQPDVRECFFIRAPPLPTLLRCVCVCVSFKCMRSYKHPPSNLPNIPHLVPHDAAETLIAGKKEKVICEAVAM
jgi:hypothetical protein